MATQSPLGPRAVSRAATLLAAAAIVFVIRAVTAVIARRHLDSLNLEAMLAASAHDDIEYLLAGLRLDLWIGVSGAVVLAACAWTVRRPRPIARWSAVLASAVYILLTALVISGSLENAVDPGADHPDALLPGWYPILTSIITALVFLALGTAAIDLVCSSAADYYRVVQTQENPTSLADALLKAREQKVVE